MKIVIINRKLHEKANFSVRCQIRQVLSVNCQWSFPQMGRKFSKTDRINGVWIGVISKTYLFLGGSVVTLWSTTQEFASSNNPLIATDPLFLNSVDSEKVMWGKLMKSNVRSWKFWGLVLERADTNGPKKVLLYVVTDNMKNCNNRHELCRSGADTTWFVYIDTSSYNYRLHGLSLSLEAATKCSLF